MLSHEEKVKLQCQEKIQSLLEVNSLLSTELNDVSKEITALDAKISQDNLEFMKEKGKLEKEIEIMKNLDNYEMHSKQLENILQSISKRQRFFDEAIPKNDLKVSTKSKKKILDYTEAFNMNSNLLNRFP